MAQKLQGLSCGGLERDLPESRDSEEGSALPRVPELFLRSLRSLTQWGRSCFALSCCRLSQAAWFPQGTRNLLNVQNDRSDQGFVLPTFLVTYVQGKGGGKVCPLRNSQAVKTEFQSCVLHQKQNPDALNLNVVASLCADAHDLAISGLFLLSGMST